MDCHRVFKNEKIKNTFPATSVIPVAQYSVINPDTCSQVGKYKQRETELVCLVSADGMKSRKRNNKFFSFLY